MLSLRKDSDRDYSDKNILVEFTSSKQYKLVKSNYIKTENSVDKFGIRQFDYKAGNLLLNYEYVNNIFDFKAIVNGILNKYKNGVTYVDAEWTGDYNLTLDADFCAKSQYDEDGIEEVYECISSEISYDSRFKQKVKGRESQEIIH